MARLFGPCSEQTLDPIHTACAFFNTLSGEVCNCSCHTPEDIERRLAKLNLKPVETIVSKLESKAEAFEAALLNGDMKEAQRLAPRGPTYGQVVKPHSREEEQRRIDKVNEARGK